MQHEVTVEIDRHVALSVSPLAAASVTGAEQAERAITLHMGRFRGGTLVAVGSLTCLGNAGLLHGFAITPGNPTTADLGALGDALALRFAMLGGGRLSIADERAVRFMAPWDGVATPADSGLWRVHPIVTRHVEPEPWDHAAYTIDTATAQLARTPRVLRAWLGESHGLWNGWRESPTGWSLPEIVGHLAHAEATLWLPRLQHLITCGAHRPFEPFDRLGMLHRYATESLDDLIRRFGDARTHSLAALDHLALDANQLEQQGNHPDFGTVTMRQLIAAWVSHDHSHLYQITRILARPFCAAAGPWHRSIRLAAQLRA